MSDRPTILMIDDDGDVNFLHELLIKRLNLDIDLRFCTYVEKALETIRELPRMPELITLDISMPRLNGFEFLERLRREQHPLFDTRIVMLTSSANPEDRERAEKEPLVWRFMSKPLNVKELRDLTKHLSARHRKPLSPQPSRVERSP